MNGSDSFKIRVFAMLAIMFDRVDLAVLGLTLIGSAAILFGSADANDLRPITHEQIYASLGFSASTCLIVALKGVLTFLGSLLVDKKIHKAPGYRLLAFVRFFYSPKAISHVFEPLVADWHLEYFDAWDKGRRHKARWISLRYYWHAVLAMGLLRLVSVIRTVASRRG